MAEDDWVRRVGCLAWAGLRKGRFLNLFTLKRIFSRIQVAFCCLAVCSPCSIICSTKFSGLHHALYRLFIQGDKRMPYRVAERDRSPAVFSTGRHVLVDASGAGQGNYCMAAVCVSAGEVKLLYSAPCVATTSVLAEQESLLWALSLWPNAMVWNDCIPALEAVLAKQPGLAGTLFWPTPRMRKPLHDLAHALSVKARNLQSPREWTLAEFGEGWCNTQPTPP